MATWKVITPPDAEPITLDQAKGYLRIDWPDDDAFIFDQISVARQHLEAKLGRALITQTLQSVTYLADDLVQTPLSGVITGANLTQAFSYAIELPQPPLQSVSTVEIETQIGSWATLTITDDYLVDSDSLIGKVYLATSALALWTVSLNYPGSRPRVRTTYVAGYGDKANSVPYDIRGNIYQIVSWLYEHRGETSIPDELVNSDPYHVYRL